MSAGASGIMSEKSIIFFFFPQIVVALCIVGALGAAVPEAARYPAGVDPHVCPNYPNCDNVALAARASVPYAPSAPTHYAAPAYGHHAAAPVPASLPAGVDARACPNYPYCGPTPVQPQAPSGYSSWSAPAPAPQAPSAYSSWSAPAPQPSWTQPAPQPAWSNPSSQNFWSNPSAPRAAVPNFNWNTPAQSPAPSSEQGGALFPAGVDPSSCPNYPYCH
ncbi:hypothetical protein J437_LFUL011007 [Ladona fulva]|uniref:Cuticle protein CPCFC domain-containing protein n=1 Tax=Ladona fulva TaxID=123851 RepID=A0A8K0PA70_LADFU|nr:hypothetical protein J437_LFUL011007 [Ladona fulva]